MAQFPSDAQDPYKNFKLRVWDGNSVHFGGKLTGLFPPEVANYREGGGLSVIKPPGRTKYDAVTLNRGGTHDQSFSNWASQVWNYESALGAEVPLANFRKDIFLEFYNEAGQSLVTYRMSNGWVIESLASPPGGTIKHLLQPARGSIEEQLAAIFESSLRRLRP
jgi:phage tail-like protein